MRFRLSRYALTLTLSLVASASASESYIVILKNPFGIEEHVQIVNDKGVFGSIAPGYGTRVGEYIWTVHRIEPEQLNRDFGPALAAMSEILAAGLPTLPYSYTALLEKPQGPVGELVIDSSKGRAVIDKAGNAALIDAHSDNAPYAVDSQQIEADFGPALASLEAILETGFQPKTYVALLESPDGSVGKVSVTDARGNVLIDQAGQAVDLDTYAADNQPFSVGNDQLQQDFEAALVSRPPLPARYTLFFDSGSTKLTGESQVHTEKLLDDIRKRPAPDISIDGHADTVGKEAINNSLSKERAEFIASLIKTKGVEQSAMEIQSHGEHELLIKTPDNTPEVRNRRVEVLVR